MPESVKVYSLSDCIHCQHAKDFLDEHGVDYECVYVDRAWPDQRNRIMDEVRQVNALITFPTIVIGGDKVVVGFDEKQLSRALGL